MTRKSEAALAWISRINDSHETEYLTQWNNGWQAYSLIGGHVEAGETFRACCEREIMEELECRANLFEIDSIPIKVLRFCEFSKSAAEESVYGWQMFEVELSDELLEQLPDDCVWVTEEEILAGNTGTGKPIAKQVRRVFEAVRDA